MPSVVCRGAIAIHNTQLAIDYNGDKRNGNHCCDNHSSGDYDDDDTSFRRTHFRCTHFFEATTSLW
jgi:hypothetical protein